MWQQIYCVSSINLCGSSFSLNLLSLQSVLVIPFVQLWRVQISLRQKFILGTTLSLSIFMIVIAIIRVSKMRPGANDLATMWMTFWHQVEASTAVIMISFSACRSFFVVRESRLREDRNRHLHWYMSKKNRAAAAARRWMRFHSESEETNELPEIPRATMTGMDTFIRGAGTTGCRDGTKVCDA